MDDKKWIDGIDRKLEGFEMSPPKNLWEDIERQVHPELAGHKTIRLHNKSAWAAAAMLTGALVIGGGVWLSIHQEENPMSRPTIAKVQKVSTNSSYQESKQVLAEAESTHSAQDYRTVQNWHTGSRYTEAYHQTEDSETAMSKDLAGQSIHNDGARKAETAKRDYDYNAPSWDNTLAASHRSQKEKFSVALTASNFMNSNSQHEGYGELLTGSIWPGNDHESGKEDDVSDEFGALEEVIVGNSEKEVYTKKKHRQPVKLGISVSYHLSERWSVGTGLTYSYLSSDLTSGTDNSHYTTHQKLQYVGIPLNLSYAFYQHKRWNVYATTGGMVEKCVKGKSTTDFIVSGKKEDSQCDDVKEKKLQYSVNAAIGVQAKIADHIGFYLEPGFSYHFDNHSDVTNIYKDTPLNFSLGMGFRYSF